MQVDYEVWPIVKEYFTVYNVVESTWEEDESGSYAVNSTSEIVSTWANERDADLEALKCSILLREEGLRN